MTSSLPILGIETSGELCSVALMIDEKSFVEFNYLQKHIHSEKLIEMVESVLWHSKVELSNVKEIAVSIGPGSFTGLRIGLSAAKGLALGSNLPIVPVSTFSAYALQLADYLTGDEKFGIISNASLDEVYFAEFKKKNQQVEVVTELKLIEKTSLASLTGQTGKIFGDVEIKNIIKTPFGVTASSIAKWAYLFGKDLVTFNYDYLEPNYFKKFIPKVAR
ncbi:MAG: tRNA (adenosine(37)-N6)-threonylcarbamoyltransferase complex dimerization subunit type 1 TsaB [Bacteroidetes bacterium]|nr:tRNA (adenosine(37)-N6)-threonylcarbamoyltransferase complex dimerization subunit type 1 TsaB [Bacteroidota bacterium]